MLLTNYFLCSGPANMEEAVSGKMKSFSSEPSFTERVAHLKNGVSADGAKDLPGFAHAFYVFFWLATSPSRRTLTPIP